MKKDTSALTPEEICCRLEDADDRAVERTPFNLTSAIISLIEEVEDLDGAESLAYVIMDKNYGKCAAVMAQVLALYLANHHPYVRYGGDIDRHQLAVIVNESLEAFANDPDGRAEFYGTAAPRSTSGTAQMFMELLSAPMDTFSADSKAFFAEVGKEIGPDWIAVGRAVFAFMQMVDSFVIRKGM